MKCVSSSCGVAVQMTAAVRGSKMLYEIRGKEHTLAETLYNNAVNRKGKNQWCTKENFRSKSTCTFIPCQCHNSLPNLSLCCAMDTSCLKQTLEDLEPPSKIFHLKVTETHHLIGRNCQCKKSLIANCQHPQCTYQSSWGREERHDPSIAHEAIILYQLSKDFSFVV